MSTVRARRQPRKPPAAEPAWDVAYLYPPQGHWSEGEYFLLPGNRLVEFANGVIEVLPLPTQSHQLIMLAFYHLLLAFVQPGCWAACWSHRCVFRPAGANIVSPTCFSC